MVTGVAAAGEQSTPFPKGRGQSDVIGVGAARDFDVNAIFAKAGGLQG